MKRNVQGRYVRFATTGDSFKAFVPAPLPPRPEIDWAPELRSRFDAALVALGRLDAVTDFLPNAALLLYSFVRKEAVLSSMIEGTQSSLADLMLFELNEQPGVPVEDVSEVSCYVAAQGHGLKRLREGFPLSSRLIREVHAVLLGHGRGAALTPGEFRRSQVWVGGTRPGNAVFVPPPANELGECIRQLELFLHDQPEATAPLVKAALAHVQFETIHPFLDGNSLHFKQHRQTYYELLNAVRILGDWEAWLAFFADAVVASATQAVNSAKRLLELAAADAERIESLGRAAGSALAIHKVLQRQPIATSASLAIATGLTPATVNKSLVHLERLGVVAELTRRQRGRVFSYARFNDILNEGMGPPY
jgi:Fic family protein